MTAISNDSIFWTLKIVKGFTIVEYFSIFSDMGHKT